MSDPTPPKVPPDWWQSLFDEVYLQTDARTVQDGDLTRREVDGLIQALKLEPHETILDLCGGHGRHALELARRGYRRVTVLDFSFPLLTLGKAQARESRLPVAFIRGDAACAPLAGDSFQVVMILANSFGYGAAPEDDVAILRECHRVLHPGGRLFLEVADPDYIRRQLSAQSWHEAGDLVVCRQRWLMEEYLFCRELVLSRSGGLVRDRGYKVRLYAAARLGDSLKKAGFTQIEVAGQPDLYAREGDYGALNRRLGATAWK
ncbi:MAG: class I SAM-dependent methyltransferase [Deltaproteobacteria bacterium]|nr:class I SAM-dependent methyltransferase [Deltaproteobacteria bacterium]